MAIWEKTCAPRNLMSSMYRRRLLSCSAVRPQEDPPTEEGRATVPAGVAAHRRPAAQHARRAHGRATVARRRSLLRHRPVGPGLPSRLRHRGRAALCLRQVPHASQHWQANAEHADRPAGQRARRGHTPAAQRAVLRHAPLLALPC